MRDSFLFHLDVEQWIHAFTAFDRKQKWNATQILIKHERAKRANKQRTFLGNRIDMRRVERSAFRGIRGVAILINHASSVSLSFVRPLTACHLKRLQIIICPNRLCCPIVCFTVWAKKQKIPSHFYGDSNSCIGSPQDTQPAVPERGCI